MIINFMNRCIIWNGIVHMYIVPQEINIWTYIVSLKKIIL